MDGRLERASESRREGLRLPGRCTAMMCCAVDSVWCKARLGGEERGERKSEYEGREERGDICAIAGRTLTPLGGIREGFEFP